MREEQTIGDDVIEGAAAIARFLFGTGAQARRAYTAMRHGLPHYRIGNRIFARKGALSKWVQDQENRHAAQ